MLNLSKEQQTRLKELRKNNLDKPKVVINLLYENIKKLNNEGFLLKDILNILEKEIDFKMSYRNFTMTFKKLKEQNNDNKNGGKNQNSDSDNNSSKDEQKQNSNVNLSLNDNLNDNTNTKEEVPKWQRQIDEANAKKDI